MTTRIQHVVSALKFMYPNNDWAIDGKNAIMDGEIVFTEDNAFSYFYRHALPARMNSHKFVEKCIISIIPIVSDMKLHSSNSPCVFQYSKILNAIHRSLARNFDEDKANDIMLNLSKQGVMNDIYRYFILAKTLTTTKAYNNDKSTFCLRVLCVNNVLQVVKSYKNGINMVMHIDGDNVVIADDNPADIMNAVYEAGHMKIGEMDVSSY